MDIDFETYQKNIVHIRMYQRNGKKSITTIQGIDDKYDLHKLLKVLKNEFACNGCIVKNNDNGEIIQLQGDKRNDVNQFLIEIGMCRKDEIKIHGF